MTKKRPICVRIHTLTAGVPPLTVGRPGRTWREHRHNLGDQGIEAHGLGEHGHPGREIFIEGGSGVARDEQHWQRRPPLAGRVGQLAAVQARQADVGDEQVHLGRARQPREAPGPSSASKMVKP